MGLKVYILQEEVDIVAVYTSQEKAEAAAQELGIEYYMIYEMDVR